VKLVQVTMKPHHVEPIEDRGIRCRTDVVKLHVRYGSVLTTTV